MYGKIVANDDLQDSSAASYTAGTDLFYRFASWPTDYDDPYGG